MIVFMIGYLFVAAVVGGMNFFECRPRIGTFVVQSQCIAEACVCFWRASAIGVRWGRRTGVQATARLHR